MGKRKVVRIWDEAYLMALREVESGRERSLYDLVSKAIKFYLSAKKLMCCDLLDNMMSLARKQKELKTSPEELHSKKSTTRNNLRKQ